MLEVVQINKEEFNLHDVVQDDEYYVLHSYKKATGRIESELNFTIKRLSSFPVYKVKDIIESQEDAIVRIMEV